MLEQRIRQGILWYGMEGKNRYGIWNGSSMEWNGRFDVWNGTKCSIFHANSILAHFDTVLLKSSFSFFVISITNSNVYAKRSSLILISWGQGTLSPDFCMFTSVLPTCHCVRRDSYLASIASYVAL